MTDAGSDADADAGPGPRTCPGHLPRAVRAFFDQGGRTRVGVPGGAGDAGRAAPPRGSSCPAATPRLVAAAEGSWGGRLQVTLTYQSGPPLPRPRGSAPPAPAGDGEIVLADVPALPAGSLLVVGPSPAHPTGTLHWVVAQALRPAAPGGRMRVLTVDPPVPAAARGPDGDVDARVVTATLAVVDRDPAHRRAEQVTGLGLHPDHPRYPARPLPPDHPRHPDRLLAAESRLVRTADGWLGPVPPADGTLPPVPAEPAHGGRDRFGEIDVRSFFDPDSPDGDPLDERDDHRGVDRIGRVGGARAAVRAGPDLVRPAPPVPAHLDPQQRPRRWPRSSAASRRWSRWPSSRAALRRRCSTRRPGWPWPTSARWRAGFDTSYAAAYHPWLGRARSTEPDRRAQPVPPSAFAAGIIAGRERRLGLPWGPANELAAGAVTADDAVTGRGARRAAPAGRQRLPGRAGRVPADLRPHPQPGRPLPPAQRAPADDDDHAGRWSGRRSGWSSSRTPPDLRATPDPHRSPSSCATCTGRGAFAGRHRGGARSSSAATTG